MKELEFIIDGKQPIPKIEQSRDVLLYDLLPRLGDDAGSSVRWQVGNVRSALQLWVCCHVIRVLLDSISDATTKVQPAFSAHLFAAYNNADGIVDQVDEIDRARAAFNFAFNSAKRQDTSLRQSLLADSIYICDFVDKVVLKARSLRRNSGNQPSHSARRSD